MTPMAECNLCGGQGFVRFFHTHGSAAEEDMDNRQCPVCQGRGCIEPWLQVATGGPSQEGWTGSLPPYREEAAAILAIIRQRDECR